MVTIRSIRRSIPALLLSSLLAGLVVSLPVVPPAQAESDSAGPRSSGPAAKAPSASVAAMPEATPIPGLDSLAAATLSRALDYLDITRAELGFDKLYAEDDTFRLPLIEEILNDPLRLPGWQSETLDALRASVNDPAALAGELARLIDASDDRALPPAPWPGREGARPAPWLTSSAPSPEAAPATPPAPQRVYAEALDLEQRFETFLASARAAEQDLAQAFRDLTETDRQHLLIAAPAAWANGEEPYERARKGSLHFERGVPADTTIEADEDLLLDLAVKLDRAALTRATRQFLNGLVLLAAGAREIQLPRATIGLDGVTGPVTMTAETPWGLFVVGGPGANIYAPEALDRIAFLIEPGGDDVYRGRAASAVGTLLRPLSAVVDFAGNDLYEARDRSYAIGGAVLGIAALLDLAGDDIYCGEDGSCGAGFFGAGVLYDGAGVDIFEGRNLSQGAGAFGLGVLISDCAPEAPPGPELEPDRAFEAGLIAVPGTGARPIRYDENDTYLCARQSQGFASTFGAGLLYDREGNDTYRSGGRYLHAPLLPHDFQSLSQGFSIGFRPRAAGGVGILIDEAGNDYYDAEVYAQGAAYWYSLGLLFDGGGNDRYLETQYGQGAGIHLAIGSLWDRGGDDHYISKNGVTQGTAHDLSVGLLLDESGRDYYMVDAAHGFSITNSAAIFIDALGDDFYATYGGGQGSLTWARGFCGAGIFLDLEGRDTYPANSPGQDGAVWSQQAYGVGIDLDRDIVFPGEVVPEVVLTAQDSLRTVEELFKTASIWEVGSAREKVARARKALIAKGIPAVDYVVASKMATRDGLEYRAIEELSKAYSDSFAARILPLLASDDEQVQRNVIRLLGDLKRAEARAPMEAMLRDRRHERRWTQLIGALGAIKSPASAPAVRPFLRDPLERRRIVALGALRDLKDSTAVPQIVTLLGDPVFTVRGAAREVLRGFGAAAVGPLCAELARVALDPGSPGAGTSSAALAAQPRIALHTLGNVAGALRDSTSAPAVTARGLARRTLMEALDTPALTGAPQARAAAIEALAGLGGEPTLGFLRLRMQDEGDPLVRRTYERALAAEETR